MVVIQYETFKNDVIEVDDKEFESCGFFNCTLVYRGGKPPTFTRCSIRGGSVQIEGEAARTTNYLKMLNTTGLSSGVEALLKQIERGGLGFSSRPAPPPSVNTGDHYGRLGAYAAVMIAVTFVIMAFFWYGNLTAPNNQLDKTDDVQPFSAQVPLDSMPALPDELGVTYDELKASQLMQVTTYGWVDEERGIAQIPVEEAIDMLLAEQEASGG